MTQEELKAKLEGIEGGLDLYAAHMAMVQAEREKGINSRHEANSEAKGLRRFKIALEKLGYNAEEDGDLDEWVSDIVNKMADVGKSSTQKDSQLSELQSQLKKLTKQFQTTQEELGNEKKTRAEVETKAKQRTIQNKLQKVLNDEFYGADFLIKSLISDGVVDLDENENPVFKQGDQTLNLDKGVEWLRQTNADARKNGQKPGSGSSPASGGSVKQRPRLTVEQIKGMSRKEIMDNMADVDAAMAAESPQKG